jgi:NADH:ubiquinone oxidoreductase subunit 2 (subunit N)
MYFREPGEAASEAEPPAFSLRLALGAAALATLFLGIFPTWVLEFAGKASHSIYLYTSR